MHVNRALVMIGLLSLIAATADAAVKIGTHTVGDYTDDTEYKDYVKFITVPRDKQSDPDFSGTDVAKIKALESNPNLAKQMFDAMKASTATFTFSDRAEATNTIWMRLQIVAKITTWSTFWTMGGNGTTAPSEWEPAKNTEGRTIQIMQRKFMQKANTNLTQAVTHLVDGSTRTEGECEGAIYACFWWGSLQADATRFANSHQGETLTMWNFTKAIGKHASLRSDVVTGTYPGAISVEEARIVVGDYLYMVNYLYGPAVAYEDFKTKGWIDKNKTYFWNGENCICVGHATDGKPLFAGAGVVGSKKEAELREELRQAYNSDLAKVITNKGVMKKPVKLLTLTFNEDAPIDKEITAGTDANVKIAFLSANEPLISK